MNRGIKYFLMSAGGVLFCVVAVSSYYAGYFRDFRYIFDRSEEDCAFLPGIWKCKDLFNKHEDLMDSVDATFAVIDVIDSGEKSEKVFQQSLRAIEANWASIEEVGNKWDRDRGVGKITIVQILYMHMFHDVALLSFECETAAPVLRDHYQRGLLFRESDKLKRPGSPGVSIMTFLDESCPRQMEPETQSDIDSSSNDWWGSKAVWFLFEVTITEFMTDILLYMMLLILSLLVMMRVSGVQALLSRVLLISLLFCTISVAIDYASYFFLFPLFEETTGRMIGPIGPFVPKLDIGLLLSSACVSSVIGLLFYFKNKTSSPLAI